jgi:GNAT superfamily N-acetyltransferase
MRHHAKASRLVAWSFSNPKIELFRNDSGGHALEIVKASQEHVAEVARLFDLYRQFYECEPDIELATRFISERIGNDEADIFVALDGDKAIGFTQLYPSFCSVDAAKIYILYDLYVDADSRNAGVGAKLMNRATDWARENGAARLDLLTENNNFAGQHLYEKLGYERTNEEFFAYSLTVK